MDLLVSSIHAELNQPLHVHLSQINKHILNSSSGQLYETHFLSTASVSHSQNGEQYFSYYNDVLSICSSLNEDSMLSARKSAESLLHAYSDSRHTSVSFVPIEYLEGHSCVLIDKSLSRMWLVADAAGSIPLWYAFSDGITSTNYIATTDLFAAYHLGFRELTALGAGQILSVDIDSNELLSLDYWLPRALNVSANTGSTQRSGSSSELPSSADLYARSLLSAAMTSINLLAPAGGAGPLIELDPLHPASLLLDCACDVLQVSRAVRLTRPLVVDQEMPALLEAIVGPVIDSAKQTHTRIREPTLRRIASERWAMCSAAARGDPSGDGTLVSFDTGRKPRPLAVYLQNLLCPLVGVAVRYPFGMAGVQKAIWAVNAHVSDSYIQQSVPILRHSGICRPAVDSNVRKFNLSSDLLPCEGAACVDVAIAYTGGSFASTTSGGPGGGDTTHGNSSSHSTAFASLWRAAQTHANPDGFIVLLLATAGYSHLLENFLVAASRLKGPDGAPKPFRHFLVVTSDQQTADIALRYNVGFHLLAATNGTDSSADFGTLSYQRLVLRRTECALELLLMGLQPIVADIDAVWLSDPLLQLELPETPQAPRYDVGITDDNGEVCGCFVVLLRGENSVRFWTEVLSQHRDLVRQSAAGGTLPKFSDSEQKILTDLIYRKQFRGEVVVRLLSRDQFPSGYEYFNTRSTRAPAVVHNNFLIGKDMKITRFQRYGLWMMPPLGARAGDDGPDPAPHSWQRVFSVVFQNTTLPSMTVVLPVHGTVLSGTAVNASEPQPHVMVQVSKEGRARTAGGGESLSVWLDNDPPAVYTFNQSGIFSIVAHHAGTVSTITGLVERTGLVVSSDLGLARSTFASDRHHQAANGRVLGVIREMKRKSSPREVTPGLADIVNGVATASDANQDGGLAVWYTIKVLTMKRADSLHRLLRSLSDSDYGGNKNVSLEVFVDAAKTAQDADEVQRTILTAEQFVWPHGAKSVTARGANRGLAYQWFHAWSPRSEEPGEIAFVFEDDTEVSPYFFTWASAAVRKYYSAGGSGQLDAHRELLAAVRRQISANDADSGDAASSPMNAFAERFAGEPLLYGVCLQKQHLDPQRYPQRLEVRNGHRPFLYSLVGSWGPALFPLPWLAFQEWWRWRSAVSRARNVFEPLTESLVVNHWYKSNPSIWTPWIVRFAHETGAKCLYSNLPGDHALVVNHREVGENYGRALGASGLLLSREALATAGITGRGAGDASAKALRWSLLHFPAPSCLSQWQFDLHLRRPGALGVDAGAHEDDGAGDTELASALQDRATFLEWYGSVAAERAVQLSAGHWTAIADILEARLLPDAVLLHVGRSPLLPMLAHTFLRHVALFDCAPEHADCVSAERDISHVAFSAVVINLSQLPLRKPSAEGDTAGLSSLWLHLRPVEHILVLDSLCSGAPTDIDVQFGWQSSATDGSIDGVAVTHTVRYYAVEDVCAVGAADGGGVLFRRATSPPHRFALSRRFRGDLITRKTVDLDELSAYS